MNHRTQAWNNALAVNSGTVQSQISEDDIQGTIPVGLRGGRLLSNGPGWNQYGEQVIHPFDGHGYLRVFGFLEDGSVSFQADFINTEVYQIESQSKQFEIRGFATNPSKHFWQNIGFGKPRNVANTTIYRWQDTLIAGWEGGVPHAIDAKTLETIGEETFGGLIANQTTLAHMVHDLDQDRLILVNTTMGKDTKLTFHELDHHNNPVQQMTGTLEGPAFVHDFCMTSNWYIVGGNPLSINLWKAGKAFLGSGTLLTAVRANTQKQGELVLISRHQPEMQRRIQLPLPAFVVHFANAFEESDGTVVVDACIFHDFPFGEEFGYTGRDTPFDPTLPEKRGPQTLYRITIPPTADTGSWIKLTDYGVDFPRVLAEYNGKDAPFMVGATRSDKRFSDPFDSVLFLDLQTPDAAAKLWTTNDTTFVGEPIPVSAADGQQYILVMLTDGKQRHNTLAIFEPDGLSEGPICEIPLPFMPLAFHGEWDPMSIASSSTSDIL